MNLVLLEFQFPDMSKKVKRELQGILLFIAAEIQYNRGMLFDAEGAYNGHKGWAPLRMRHGQILSNRGDLRKSIAPRSGAGEPGLNARPGQANGSIVRMSGDVIEIGTDLLPARLMNDGTVNMPDGVLRPTRAKALRIPIPDGRQFSFLRKDMEQTTPGRKLLGMEQKLRRWEGLRAESVSTNDLKKKLRGMRQRHGEIRSLSQRRKLGRKIARLEKSLQGTKKNQRFIFRKWVRIPARPFDNWTSQDAEELGDALARKLVSVLQG